MDTLKDCRPNYIRLSRICSDRRYRLERGIFVSAGRLRRGREISYADEERLHSLLRWMNANLLAPRKLNKVHSIFWFKERVVLSAPELWRKIVELKELLDAYDYSIGYHQTRRPGYIVYEDAYQIALSRFEIRSIAL